MRRVAAILVIAALVRPEPRPARAAGQRAVGFDHRWHEGKVSVAGGSPIGCDRCHTIDGQGLLDDRPGHGACFGDCHGTAPTTGRLGRGRYAIAPEQRKVCTLCHADAHLSRLESGAASRLTVPFPPYAIDPDHGLVISHAKHAAPSRGAGGCLACHDRPADARKPRSPAPPPNAHQRCARCHASPRATDAAMPSMNQCSACHPQQYGPLTAPHQQRGPYPVTATFSHRAHADRGATGCVVCHEQINQTHGDELPAPGMATCATCHDGTQAFATVGVQCRACHQQYTPDPEVTRPRPGRRFEHRVHLEQAASRGDPQAGKMTCATCHTLDRRGDPLPPGADHAPCSDAGCHRQDFAAREPTICGACHVGIEPWRELHFDRPPRPDTEFGARFSHRTHLADTCRDAPCQEQCASCHRSARGDMDRQLPRDHTTCAGADCHRPGPKAASRDAGSPAAPPLTECQACHALDLVTAHQTRRTAARWSVRARFRHEPHASDPRTSTPLTCVTCHAGVAQSTAMDDIATPTKSTCLPCHDGKVAFKVTGHGCVRCHARAPAAR